MRNPTITTIPSSRNPPAYERKGLELFMSEYNKLRKNVILLSCCILIIIVTAVCVSAFLSGRKKEKDESAANRTVAFVGDFKISENQFRFFARIVLNQEEDTVRMLYTNPSLSDKDEIKKYTSNFTKEYIIRVLEAQAAGVTVTVEEAAQLEEQFETDYENAKSVDGKTLDKEEFYKYYYGITEDEYKEFWRNWFLIDKYTTICEQNADVGEDAQRQAFEEYYDYLYCYNTSVIPLYIDAANSKEQQTEKANAILASLNEGADFAELLRQNSTDQELIDDAGAMKFYPVNKYEYGEVYDWLRSAEPGSTGAVQTDTVVYVIRLDSVTDFDQLKDSETMLQWTRTFRVNKELNELLNSDKYYYAVDQEVYDALDLSDILNEAYEYWKTVWENEG